MMGSIVKFMTDLNPKKKDIIRDSVCLAKLLQALIQRFKTEVAIPLSMVNFHPMLRLLEQNDLRGVALETLTLLVKNNVRLSDPVLINISMSLCEGLAESINALSLVGNKFEKCKTYFKL